MVLSLPVPSFARSSSSTTTPSPLRPADPNTSTTGSNGTNPNTGTKHTWSLNLSLNLNLRSSAGSTTLAEALRNNPFGLPRSPIANQHPAEQTPGGQEQEQEEANAALDVLAEVFPDVKVEVFRELVGRFDGESRVQVCVEQLVRYKDEWVGGRYKSSGNNTGDDTAPLRERPREGERIVPIEERFRSESYKAAVRTALGKEFSSLSKSTVDAVLADVNHSYTRARPVLRDLGRRTWRATVSSFLPGFRRRREREKERERDEHPLVVWHRVSAGAGAGTGQGDAAGELVLVPRVKESGCEEFDEEVRTTLVEPLLRARKAEQEGKDFRLAEEMNEVEARAVDALYECECCLSDVTFEAIATCSVSAHVICYGCIRRTVQEALFGQGWDKSVDPAKATLRCLAPAPLAAGPCEGSLLAQVVKQAILLDASGVETYGKFEDRIAADALFKSQMKLIRCPFCGYAEADPVHHPTARGIRWRFRRDNPFTTFLFLLIFIIPALVFLLIHPRLLRSTLHSALQTHCLTTRPKRFTCARASCARTSCLTCTKPWRDPHVCDEPYLLDLRATVEAARTAAVKRTCPRCGLAFVKASGCNKLTCVCGYSMCYLCRKALGVPMPSPQGQGQAQRQRRPASGGRRRNPNPARRRRARGNALFNQENINIMDYPLFPVDAGDLEPLQPPSSSDENEDININEEVEGYNHFCSHFRINPGSRCTECSKCDLYASEDEEVVARRAGERAEREWLVSNAASTDPNGPVPMHLPGVRAGKGRVNVNMEFSSPSFASGSGFGDANRNGKAGRRGKPGLGVQTGHMVRSLAGGVKYYGYEIWGDGRWRLEGQGIVDGVVERVVEVVEV